MRNKKMARIAPTPLLELDSEALELLDEPERDGLEEFALTRASTKALTPLAPSEDVSGFDDS
jgi:hypothetical protein